MAAFQIIFWLMLLFLPCLISIGIITRIRGSLRVALLLLMLAAPILPIYHDHDCNVQADAEEVIDEPCRFEDILAFWGIVFDVSTTLGIAIGTTGLYLRGPRAKASNC